MAAQHVYTRPTDQAATLLEAALKKSVRKGGKLTSADAATAGGLPLREAEAALHALVARYRGTLSATDKGELLFHFPYGLSLPLTKQPWLLRAVDKVKRTVLGVGKFVVRAWISIVMVAYALIFLAVGIALATRDERGGAIVGAVLRVVFEALWWTFHPFSPFAAVNVWDDRSWGRPREKKAPFYQRVNRFVFGPEEKKPDAQELERRILLQMRAHKGRIGIGDVLRVTGLPREEADPLMARLMLDYQGEVKVTDDGAIFYEFPDVRRTVEQGHVVAPPPVWREQVKARPITGNDGGSNWTVTLLNGFNLAMSLVAMKTNLTIDRLLHIIEHWKSVVPVPPLPYDGTPLVFGLIPFVFSALIFALPVYRWATDAKRKKQAAEENGRRAVLKAVLEATGKGEGVTEGKLKGAWQQATGEEPDLSTLRRQVVELGGDIDLEEAEDTGRAPYRFRDLEAEVKALAAERSQASDEEQQVGKVVFASG
ncbi:MAG: hypothetical protein A2138_21720 [Deltaproteobacteria bacterium RBG_16_71_12]|nr:MAG: hypothetical protein A2138_21720 [Deltaproteobacteria bacterium RBG_16_71_12]